MQTSQNEPQTIEALRSRYEQLNTRKITAEANYKTAHKNLEQLKATAKAQWGTDDLDELRRKLEEIEAENQRKRREYQAQLDKIESDLREVDQKFTATEAKK